ncbi:MAG: zinc ribbon domain-containing protein, partial [Myxococcales bacterium]|nr:zinc ribbon domain-containing protein [Myxococcales bacterium]
MQTCSHCGCENPDGIAYCRDCGMTLRTQPPRVAAPTPTPELAAAAGLIPAPYGAVPASSPAVLAAPVAAPALHSPPAQAVGNTLRSEQAQSLEVACPRCHERNPVESRFCHSCGYAVGAAAAPSGSPEPAAPAAPPPMAAPPGPPICARCRGTNDPGSDFCKFCGARLTVVAAAQQAPLEPTDPHAAVPGFPNLSPALANGPIPMRTAMVVETRAGQVSNQPGPAPQAAAAGPPNVAPSPSNPAMPAVRPTAPPQAFDSQDPRPQEHGVTRPHQGIGEIVRAHIVRIAKDGSEGVHHPITADVTDVGRTEGQILLPDDPYLSPRHARIVARPSPAIGGRATLTVIDLGSVNGVFVRLRAPHTLVHGDLLLLGQQVLRFEAVTEIEGARGPAMQHGVLLFGSP